MAKRDFGAGALFPASADRDCAAGCPDFPNRPVYGDLLPTSANRGFPDLSKKLDGNLFPASANGDAELGFQNYTKVGPGVLFSE